MGCLLQCLLFMGISVQFAKFCHQNEMRFQSHHRCVTKNETYISYPSQSRHNCVINCSRRQDCQVVNFNSLSQICYLTDQPCMILEADDHHATYFKPPPDTCLRWISLGQHSPDHAIYLHPCHIPRHKIYLYCYIGRRMSPPHTLPGSVYLYDETYTALDGNIVRTGSWEALQVTPGCPVQWIPYTAGNDIPTRSVIGGHLASGTSSNIYIIRVKTIWNGYGIILPGYYDPISQRAYAVFNTVLTFTEMEMLVVE